MNVKRRHMSLIEVLIAMGLISLVLTTLLFFYQQMTSIGYDIDKIQAENFHLRYVENRLSEILPKATNEKSKADFVFFSLQDDGIGMDGSQSLLFTFDNEVSRDPEFSNTSVGRLYLDKQGNLTLAYWPLPKRQEAGTKIPMKKEILLAHVERLSFEFFIPPEKPGENLVLKPKEESSSPEPKGAWRKQVWQKDFAMLPAMVKLNLELKKQENLTFIFPLVNSQTPIFYE